LFFPIKKKKGGGKKEGFLKKNSHDRKKGKRKPTKFRSGTKKKQERSSVSSGLREKKERKKERREKPQRRGGGGARLLSHNACDTLFSCPPRKKREEWPRKRGTARMFSYKQRRRAEKGFPLFSNREKSDEEPSSMFACGSNTGRKYNVTSPSGKEGRDGKSFPDQIPVEHP